MQNPSRSSTEWVTNELGVVRCFQVVGGIVLCNPMDNYELNTSISNMTVFN